MTSRIPYVKERTDFLVIKAIMQGELPASLDHPSISKSLAEMLAKCWSIEPGSRPTMTWCSECFAWQTLKLFDAYYGHHINGISPNHKTEGDGWRAVRNPAALKTYKFEFTLDFPGVRYVV